LNVCVAADPPDRGGGEPARVLVTWPDYDVDDVALGAALVAAGLELALEPKLGARSTADLLAIARDADGAIVSTDPFDASVLEACPRLKVIARVGVGVDSIDLTTATELGIAVTTTPGANEAAVADHAVALMLAVVRRVAEHDAAVRRGEWNRTGADTPWELTDATVGLVGYGAIGRLVARRLAGFGVRLLVSDPVVVEDDADAERVALERLLRESDIVSLHAPLLPTTRSLIGPEQLALMQPTAVLVNTARGGVVDEPALIDALEHGRLRGAALDVFDEEPPRSERLLALRNVVLTPHVGGLSERSIREMTARATRSVLDVLHGRTPRDLANPAVVAHRRFDRVVAPAAERL
jgi:phosphoglycerate dehydrogenase-like enzyme